jgi:micrococcal nuclease
MPQTPFILVLTIALLVGCTSHSSNGLKENNQEISAQDAQTEYIPSDIKSGSVKESEVPIEDKDTTDKHFTYPKMPENLQRARVTYVTDGDTFKIELKGHAGEVIRDTVRPIGINTPETVDPNKLTECFGPEASEKAKTLLESNFVFLESDPSQGNRGYFDRLLRYVWLENGKMFNIEMIIGGYSPEFTYNDPYFYRNTFVDAERQAKLYGRGLWTACGYGTGAEIEANISQDSSCDSAYPDFCIKPPPPDLDCKDIPEKAFTVLPPDPHRFDGNQDGIGCVG